MTIIDQAVVELSCASKEAWQIVIDDQCNRNNFPMVPFTTFAIGDVVKMKSFSGVYFLWPGLLCSYVGKSVDVTRRIRDHRGPGGKIETGMEKVSFVKMPYDECHYLELFYIWLLRPELNLFTEMK